jgi:uncharacterized protein
LLPVIFENHLKIGSINMSIWDVLLAGVALMLIFEGIMPFVSPATWKDTMRQAINLSDGQLRFLGLVAIAIGLALLFFLR